MFRWLKINSGVDSIIMLRVHPTFTKESSFCHVCKLMLFALRLNYASSRMLLLHYVSTRCYWSMLIRFSDSKSDVMLDKPTDNMEKEVLDITGMFHWCPPRLLESAVLVCIAMNVWDAGELSGLIRVPAPNREKFTFYRLYMNVFDNFYLGGGGHKT